MSHGLVLVPTKFIVERKVTNFIALIANHVFSTRALGNAQCSTMHLASNSVCGGLFTHGKVPCQNPAKTNAINAMRQHYVVIICRIFSQLGNNP